MVDEATRTTQTAAASGPRGPRTGWPRPMRWTAYAAIVLVLVLIAVLIGGVVVVRRSWPQTSGTLQLAGLDGSVRVVRDDHGIPQIYADTMHDLMLAQGFVSAQERFFEMDVRRHATAGRLSEMFGKAGLETDLVTRTLGWRRVARRELTLLTPETRNALDAYAEGVNDYLDGRALSKISLEYTLLDATGLDYHPAKWTAVDSVSWLKAMAWDLRGNVDDEIARALSIARVGKQRAAELFPDYDYAARPPIVQQGGVVHGRFDQDAEGSRSRGAARPTLGPAVLEALAGVGQTLDGVPPMLGKGDGIGSNAWVVSGAHTDTGAPILANDPHLGVSLPGVWMQIGLHCRTVDAECPMDVAGFSFSGVPGVVIGHNDHIAWGFTNLGPDVSDLYVERVKGDRWQYGHRMLPLRTRTETIKVHGGKDITYQVRSTKHGPLLSDIAALEETDDEVDLTDDGLVPSAADAGDAHGVGRGDWQTGVALDWTALRPRPTADALFALDEATDWSSFHRALADFAAPGQNVVYADTTGHIGYQATGQVPIRRPGNDGLVPAAGWRPETDWTGRYVPYEAMPRVLDPVSGIIVTANQAVIDPTRYPYHLTEDWDRGFRSTRIRQLLEDDQRLSVRSMSAIQLDDLNPMARVLDPYLTDIRLRGGYYPDGQRLLRTWNGRQSADSAAAAYFNVVWRELLRRTFDDELPDALRPDGASRWMDVVARLLTRPHDKFWDDVTTDAVESRDDILEQSLKAARDDLTRLESPDPDDWTWGALHRLELRSSTLGESGIAPVEALFNRGRWKVGGGGSLVDATAWDARKGYDVTAAPSMRMVVPLDDLDQARWINLTGVSGHAFNSHYTDQTDLWARGDTLPWVFSDKAVEAAGDDELTLEPEE